jgi:hypothetical protein
MFAAILVLETKHVLMSIYGLQTLTFNDAFKDETAKTLKSPSLSQCL